MSYLNQKLILPVMLCSAPARRPLLRMVLRWLQRGWQSECRRAVRPDRVVPYY